MTMIDRPEDQTRPRAIPLPRTAPPSLTVQVFPSDDPDALSDGCWGTPETVAAWMHAYADRLTRGKVSWHGIHPTHASGEEDR